MKCSLRARVGSLFDETAQLQKHFFAGYSSFDVIPLACGQ
jgi:hypothetical protein